ncbi:MAG: hypothetical protein H0X51_09860 [Parachlamydiaceae bacterium]|nr:hypothetical protein [Parachlamydiaceae bacterium]
MTDCSKIGGQYFQATQDVFSCKKSKGDCTTKAISAALILSWFTLVIPVFCALLYGAACLQGRCKSQKTATYPQERISTAAKDAGVESQPKAASVESSSKAVPKPVSQLPEEYATFARFVSCPARVPASADFTMHQTLTIKTLTDKKFTIHYAKDCLAGHLQALLATHCEYECSYANLRLIYAGKQFQSKDRLDMHFTQDDASVYLVVRSEG